MMIGETIYITENEVYTVIGIQPAEEEAIIDLVLNLELRNDFTGEVLQFGLWTEDIEDKEASLYLCIPTDEPEYEDDPLDIIYLEHSLSYYGRSLDEFIR